MSEPRRRRPPPPEELERAATAPPEHSVGPAIEEYLQSKGFGAVVDFGLLCEVWEQVVGHEVAAHCRPRRLEQDELVVEADHQGWLTELTFQSASILARLESQ